MAILFQGNIFNTGPVVSGSKMRGHCWKYCPYSTQITTYNQDSRVPAIEKVFHQETGGFLYTYSIGGPIGWVCPDNGCSFYLGTATTAVPQAGRKFVPASGTTSCAADLPTLSGSVRHLSIDRVVVSGTRYYEI